MWRRGKSTLTALGLAKRRLAVGTLFALVLAIGAGPAAAGEPDATAPTYDVALKGTERGFHWWGRETIEFTNPGTVPLDRIWIRQWGNGEGLCPRDQWVQIGNAAGATASAPSADCTAVALVLDAPLAPGARGSVSFDVDIRVPNGGGRFGVDPGFQGEGSIVRLSNAIPVLAHLEGGAWRLDPYFSLGEAWTYPLADWTVRLDPPRGMSVAAPGVRQPDGSRRLRRGRDYSLAAGQFRSLKGRVDGVAVTVWAVRERFGARLERVLRIVRKRMRRLARLFGPYGWPDLQVVLTRGGMEHTGLIMTRLSDRMITHELALQWWYALIGNDQATEPWLDEAFASYAEEAAGARRRPWCRAPGPATTIELVTRGVDHFSGSNSPDYGLVYSEGACLLDLLRDRMGRARFTQALRSYALAKRWGWSTAREFRAMMDTFSRVPLDDLWSLYRVG